MRRAIDMTGKRVGRLTVISRAGSSCGMATWNCACDCGNEVVCIGNNLRTGNTRSCGCLSRDTAKENGKKSVKHGMDGTILYRKWDGMKRRCFSVTHKDYHRYGARGISVCDEWRYDFLEFHKWAMSSGYVDGLQLDRIDNNGPYSPDNCQWLTASEHAKKTRRGNHE